jgi:hypothetical protein
MAWVERLTETSLRVRTAKPSPLSTIDIKKQRAKYMSVFHHTVVRNMDNHIAILEHLQESF